MTVDKPIIDPQPGAYLFVNQSQRVECLRAALHLTAGRSVPIQVVWAIARWLFDNRDET